MADKAIKTARVKLYDGGKLIGEWIAADAKIIHVYDRVIAFKDLDTKKTVKIAGTYVVEFDDDLGWFQ